MFAVPSWFLAPSEKQKAAEAAQIMVDGRFNYYNYAHQSWAKDNPLLEVRQVIDFSTLN